jgi:D-glycero-beta-D-manno-heptose-7-phosphate kinase
VNKNSSLFKKFLKLNVLVVGDVMLDTYLSGDVERISPEAPVPVVAIAGKEHRPGGAANVALNIKSLGASPVLCSVIGKDYSGDIFCSILKDHGISSDGLLRTSKRLTTEKTRIISRNHQMMRFDSEIVDDLDDSTEKKFLKIIHTLIETEKPDAIIFEDYDKGVLTPQVIRTIISICKPKKIFAAVDPKRKHFFDYTDVDLFKPNLRELREALHLEAIEISGKSLQQVSDKLRRQLQHHITVITLSEEGIFYEEKNGNGIFPAHKRNVSDVSGAGDTVIAVLTLALTAGMSLSNAASLANLAGGIVCEQPGVVPISIHELEKEMNQHSITA